MVIKNGAIHSYSRELDTSVHISTEKYVGNAQLIAFTKLGCFSFHKTAHSGGILEIKVLGFVFSMNTTDK